jgi:Chaperone of endosialidase
MEKGYLTKRFYQFFFNHPTKATKMKSLHLLILFAGNCLNLHSQHIGIGTNAPHATALLEMKASNKGLLIPRTSTASRIAIVNPAKGLILYDSTTSSFWYHSGSAWVQFSTNANSWSTTGNGGINNALHFIGTTNKRSLQFKINNEYAGAIDTLGNVFFGPNAGKLNTSFNSVAIGNGAFKTAAGGEIVAIGVNSLGSNVTGIWNTALGSYSLASHKLGNLNTAIGYAAMDHDSSGAANTAVGSFALSGNIKGFYNNAFGNGALFSNDSGNYNAAVGGGALYSNKGGNENTAVGRRALYFNESGNANVAIGNWALHQNLTVSDLVAIGDSALFYNGTDAVNAVDGTMNSGIGSRAMLSNTIGFGNTALGWRALDENTTGNSNTAIGALAGTSAGNLENATAIGANALVGASNSLVLGNNVKVGIGTSEPAYKLDIRGPANPFSNIYINVKSPYGTGVILDKGAETSENQVHYRTAGIWKWSIGTNGSENFKLSNWYLNLDALTVNVASNNVGIGISNAASKLHIQGANIANTPAGDIIMARYWAGNSDTRASSIFHFYNTGNSSDNLAFAVSGDGGSNGQPNAIGQIKMNIQANGRVGIGTITPTEKLDVVGLINAFGYRCRPGTAGFAGSNSFNIYWTGASAQLWIDAVNIGTFSYTSDRRLKDDIKLLNNHAINRMLALKPVHFKYKKIEESVFEGSPEVQEGFIADELQQVIPSAVNGEKNALTTKGTIQPQTINVIPVVAVLTKAMQEQQAIIDLQNKKITTMQADIDMLKAALRSKL